jgi:hypothetical protein
MLVGLATASSAKKTQRVRASAHRRAITLTPHCCLTGGYEPRRYLVVHGAQSNSGTRPGATEAEFVLVA